MYYILSKVRIREMYIQFGLIYLYKIIFTKHLLMISNSRAQTVDNTISVQYYKLVDTKAALVQENSNDSVWACHRWKNNEQLGFLIV